MRHTVKCVCVLFCYIIIKSHKLYFWNGWKVVQTPLSELCCHQTHYVAETAFHFHLQSQEQSVTIWPRGMRSPEAFDITRWWMQNTWSSRKAGRKVDLERVLSTYQNVMSCFESYNGFSESNCVFVPLRSIWIRASQRNGGNSLGLAMNDSNVWLIISVT